MALNSLVEQITQGRYRLPGSPGGQGRADEYGVHSTVQVDVAPLPGASDAPPGRPAFLLRRTMEPTFAAYFSNPEEVAAVIAAYNHIAKGTALPAPGSLARRAPASSVSWHVTYRPHIVGGAAILLVGGLGYWWWRRRR
jgi:hypothetical protein